MEKRDDEKTIEDLKIKFNTAYCIGKEELSFTKLRPLLVLQKKNGLQITPASHWGFLVGFGTTPTFLDSAVTRPDGLVGKNQPDPGHFFFEAWLLR